MTAKKQAERGLEADPQTPRGRETSSVAATAAGSRERDAERVSDPASRSGAAPRPARRVTKEGKQQLLVYLYPAGIKQLKLAQIEEDYPSVSAIVAEAVNDWLRAHRRPPTA